MMPDEIWERGRLRLQSDLKDAALALFEHVGMASSFVLPLSGENLFIAAGTKPGMAQMLAAPQPEPVEPPDRFVENWDEWFEKHNASWLAAKIAAAVRVENEACAACVEQVAGLRFKQGELSENGQAVLNYIIPHIAQSIRARMGEK